MILNEKSISSVGGLMILMMELNRVGQNVSFL